MNVWDVLAESKIGKKYRCSHNNLLYQVIETDDGIVLDLCDSNDESTSDYTVISFHSIK